jgi:transposase
MQVYGIDLSKEKFDVNFIDVKGKEKTQEVKNAVASISRFLSSVSEDGILCAEHTGAYGDLLLYLCNQMKVPIALVPGYTIKHSLGLVKGKSDPLDSKRIRDYGERFTDKLKCVEYPDENISELRQLYTLRNQLVKNRKTLRTLDKGRGVLPMHSIDAHKHINNVLATMDEEIASIEDEIETLILADPEMKDSYGLVTSIIGIGPVIATNLIIKTGNFKIIDTQRRAASYAGVCPFPNTSGKMVGKSKTSHFADKELKALLYMGAKAAVKHNKEFKLYYQKKELEGKPYFLIMNNLSNKLLRIAYSVVKNKIPYTKEHMCLDPRERNNSSSSKKVA